MVINWYFFIIVGQGCQPLMRSKLPAAARSTHGRTAAGLLDVHHKIFLDKLIFIYTVLYSLKYTVVYKGSNYMAKKIKSFTVDEDIYNRLVKMFKKYKAETSISMYLNNEIKYLLEQLEDLEEGIKEWNYTIPMSYIIDTMVKDSARSGRISKEINESKYPISDRERQLTEYWGKSYEAEKQGIPFEYFDYVKNGDWMLSKDKKFIINKKTGDKYCYLNGFLMQVIENKNATNLNEKKEKKKGIKK